jgi:16S rRNA (cytidine1402-2'-O)-methyltransferase
MEQSEKNKVEKSTLYLVGTPIGNLADMTERAKKLLSEVDFIAAEDTRNSMKLLSCFGIHAELVSYHEHNRHESGARIVARLLGGESCAIITDAGMPAISDPGEDLVRLCAEAGVTVRVVPGPSASVSALALSGLPTAKFVFEGFLPAQKGDRRKRLDALKGEERTMIFYEAPHKLVNTLEDMAEHFGPDRSVSICRELTKLHEEVILTTLGDAIAKYAETSPKGEFVLVVAGAPEVVTEEASIEDAAARVSQLMEAGLSRKDAVKQTALELNLPKNAVYDAALK